MHRFIIRPYREDDVDAVYAAADQSREHVGRWMGWMKPGYCIDDTRKWIEESIAHWRQGDSYEHLIIDTEDGQVAGACGLNHINRKELVCNLGYWVRASKRGLGAARQATLQLRDFGFETVGLNRIEIVVADGNQPSRRVAESVGAVYEGLQRMRLKVRERVYNAHMYALLNPRVKVVGECQNARTDG